METPEINALIDGLNAKEVTARLAALKSLKEEIDAGRLAAPIQTDDTNNHIHTFYSFSPYSPAKAVWQAYMSGLKTAGLMDHDTIAGADEFIKAGKILGVHTTIGLECRADFSGTRLSGRRINNPDQNSVAYIALHGVPHNQTAVLNAFFAPLLQKRNIRNRQMTEKINALMKPYSISLDFDADVLPLSKAAEGGSITERHLLYALSLKLTEKFGKGAPLIAFLTRDMKITVPNKILGYLSDENNSCYEYDLLGVLKSDLIEKIYLPATAECPPVDEVAALAKRTGAILAYAYLGDVGQSVTGDKKAQLFEDGYLDLLFDVLIEKKFDAVTYMPARNTPEQLTRIREKCGACGLFQISGEDINSPRQSFICMAQRAPEFKNLYYAAYALIAHELEASKDISNGMFSGYTKVKYPILDERVKIYAEKVLQKS